MLGLPVLEAEEPAPGDPERTEPRGAQVHHHHAPAQHAQAQDCPRQRAGKILLELAAAPLESRAIYSKGYGIN